MFYQVLFKLRKVLLEGMCPLKPMREGWLWQNGGGHFNHIGQACRVPVNISGEGHPQPTQSCGWPYYITEPCSDSKLDTPPARVETKELHIIVSTMSGDLAWWVLRTPHFHNNQDITPPPFHLSIWVDAILQGWGMQPPGTIKPGDAWGMF